MPVRSSERQGGQVFRFTRRNGRTAVVALVLISLLNLLGAGGVFADQWGAQDVNDNPDGVDKWFAPWSTHHTASWWDVDRCDETTVETTWHMDQVADDHLQWRWNIQDLFRANPDNNLVHEVNTGRFYEALDWYYTNLPTPDHNEDSSEAEEIYDAREEKELGWANPSWQIPGSSQWGVGERIIYTGFGPVGCYDNDPWIWFDSESELTRPNPNFPYDDWLPADWDRLGYMEGCCRK